MAWPKGTSRKRRSDRINASPKEKTAMMKVMRGVPLKEALVEAGLSKHTVPSQLRTRDGWNELLDKHLPEDKLVKQHEGGIEATHFVGHGEGMQEVPDHVTRRYYLELAYKLRGRLNNDVNQGGNTYTFNLYSAEQLKRIAARVIRDGGGQEQGAPDGLHDSNKPEVRTELAPRTDSA